MNRRRYDDAYQDEPIVYDDQPASQEEEPYYEEEPIYEDPLYQEPEEEDDAAYEQEERGAWRPQWSAREPKEPLPVLSNNATINLVGTLSAASGLLGLFFAFAEQRNRFIRQYAVQSAGLFLLTAVCIVLLGLVGTLLGWVPLIGGVLKGLVWVIGVGLFVGSLCLRAKLMLHAYRGEGYNVPFLYGMFQQFV